MDETDIQIRRLLQGIEQAEKNKASLAKTVVSLVVRNRVRARLIARNLDVTKTYQGFCERNAAFLRAVKLQKLAQ